MKLFKILIVIGAVSLLGATSFIYFGAFNIAADDRHTKPVYWLLETLRERSIAMRVSDIKVPPLDDPTMISAGGADYNEMCTGCHLQPGVEQSELASAMYPQPPSLARVRREQPAETFWIIKHGIKMSGMPAWGATHDDKRMWAIVAFLQQLPRLTPVQYQILTTRNAGDMNAHAHSDTNMHKMTMPAKDHVNERAH